MSFAINQDDIVKIVLYQELFEQEVINVFYFQANLDNANQPISSTKALGEFKLTYVDQYVPRLANSLAFRRAELTLLDGNLFPFEVLNLNYNASGLGQAAPSFNALSMTYVTGVRAVRAGGKRIAGIPEDQMSNNFFLAPYTASWQSLANSWVLGMDGYNDMNVLVGNLAPRVVSSKNWVNGVPTIVADVQSISVGAGVTSQVSRKRGKGS